MRTLQTPIETHTERWAFREWVEPTMAVGTTYDLKVTIDNTEYTVWTATELISDLVYKYGDFKIACMVSPSWPASNVKAFFDILYNNWIADHALGYAKIAKALEEEYDPIYNVEEHTTDKMLHGHTITRDRDDGDGGSNDTSIYGLNSGTGGAKSETSEWSSTHTEDTTDTHSGTDTRTIDRSGNIGLVSPADILFTEWRLRKRSLTEEAIRDLVYSISAI